jgi:hypothetical protein
MLTKVEELEDYSRRALVNFPKAERHLLTAEVRQHLHAFLAYAKHCNSWNTVNHIVDQLILKRDFADVEFTDCHYQ